MSNELYHHGVLGMKWGVRRYQNPDGTLIHPKTSRKAGGFLQDHREKRAIKKQEKKEYKVFKKAADKANFDNRSKVAEEYRNRLSRDSNYTRLQKDADSKLKKYKTAAKIDNTAQEIINTKNEIHSDDPSQPKKYREDSLLDTIARSATETAREINRKPAEESAKELIKYEQKIGEKYVRKMNEATLRDIKYNDSYEKGLKYLQKARLDYVIDADGNLTNRRFIRNAHTVKKPGTDKYERYDSWYDTYPYRRSDD